MLIRRTANVYGHQSPLIRIPLGRKREGIIEVVNKPSIQFHDNYDLQRRILADLRDFTIDRIYASDKNIAKMGVQKRAEHIDGLKTTFSEDVFMSRVLDVDSLLVLREDLSVTGDVPPDYPVIGYASSNLYPDKNLLYLSSTMISPNIPYSELAMLRLNFFLVHNGLSFLWENKDDYVLPQIVTKTRNPMVLKYCGVFFNPYYDYGKLPSSGITAGESDAMLEKLNSAFGWRMNSKWIIEDAYPLGVRTNKMDEDIETLVTKIERTKINTIMDAAISIISDLGPRDALVFAGDIKVDQFLKLADYRDLTIDPFESWVIDVMRSKSNND